MSLHFVDDEYRPLPYWFVAVVRAAGVFGILWAVMQVCIRVAVWTGGVTP